jgi:hypothetical protein
MADIPQGNSAAKDEPAPLRTKMFNQFSGVYTKATRTAIPEGYFYDIENAIPIGDENVHVVNNISASLVNYGATDIIYYSQSVNLNLTDYLVNFATTGKVFFYNIATQTSAEVNTGTLLSGSGSRCAQWENSAILFIDSTGYYYYDGTTFALITGTGVPTTGTDIAVYSSYIWIISGRLLYVSGLGGGEIYTAAAWTAANGAQIVVLIDPSIRGSVSRLMAANGYLYLFGETSVNAISDVYIPTGASPPIPQFSNQNIQALIGTDQPASVFPYDRMIMFASRYGTHSLYGVSAPKVSGDIDGTWQYIDFTQQISGGAVVVENILCSAFLLKLLASPADKVPAKTIVALWFQTSDTSPETGATETTDIWWFANYGALTFIVTGMVSNTPSLFGFIGNQLYQLFEDPTTAPMVTVQTKLWPMEDEIARKECITAGFEAFYYLFGSAFTLTLDTENGSTPLTLSENIAQGNWINAAAVQGQWVNAASQIGGWAAPATYISPADAQGGFGHHVGLTLQSTGYSYELHFLALDYKLRDRWL